MYICMTHSHLLRLTNGDSISMSQQFEVNDIQGRWKTERRMHLWYLMVLYTGAWVISASFFSTDGRHTISYNQKTWESTQIPEHLFPNHHCVINTRMILGIKQGRVDPKLSK